MRLSITVLLIFVPSVPFVLAQEPMEDPSREQLLIDDRVDHSALDRVLLAVVEGERVDYATLRSDHLPGLKRYLQQIARVETSVLGREELLAYYINLYNSTMLRAVVDRYHESYSPAENDFAVFKDKLVRLHDRDISLNELENEIIRKQFPDEPRIHVAVVCAAASCPPLLPRAYRADDLDQVLEQNMRRFVNDPVRNPIDHEKKQAKLSKIFEWYADDFGGKDKLINYLNRYSERDLTGYEISFVDYSWELNDLKRE